MPFLRLVCTSIFYFANNNANSGYYLFLLIIFLVFFKVQMTLDYFTLVLHYNGIMDGHSGRRKYIGGIVLVYDNMEIDLFSV